MNRSALLFAGLALAALPAAAQAGRFEAAAAHARRWDGVRRAAEEDFARALRARDALPWDTITYPPLRVIVRSADANRAEAGVLEAQRRLAALLGPDLGMLQGLTYRVVFGQGTTASGERVPVLGMRDSAGAGEIADALVSWAGASIANRGSPALRRWAVPALGRDGPPLFRAAREEIVTAPPGAASRCVSGDIASCRVALGLVLPPEPITTTWDSAGRHRVVTTEVLRQFRPGPDGVACAELHQDAACRRYLNRMLSRAESNRVTESALLSRLPFGTAARQALIRTALDLGGPGSIARLVDDTEASLPTLLEHAAGVPIDSVVATWRTRVLAGAVSRGLPPAAALGTLMTVMALAALSLRSTRWRTS